MVEYKIPGDGLVDLNKLVELGFKNANVKLMRGQKIVVSGVLTLIVGPLSPNLFVVTYHGDAFNIEPNDILQKG